MCVCVCKQLKCQNLTSLAGTWRPLWAALLELRAEMIRTAPCGGSR